MEDLQEEYRPGCGPHKRDEKKDFEAVAKLLMKEKTFTSAFIQKSLAMSYFKAAGSHTRKCRYDTAPAS